MFLFLAFLFFMSSGKASNFLILKRAGGRSVTFLPGSTLTCRVGKNWIQGVIDSIGMDFLILSRSKIMLNKISGVKTKRGSFSFNPIGNSLMAAGPFLLGINIINAISEKPSPFISKYTSYTGSSLVLTGILLKALAYRTYRLDGKKNQLQIIYF